MQKIKLEFTGYDNYPFDEITSIIFSSIKHKQAALDLILAVNEVVSNAARYSVSGAEGCKIKISVFIKEKEIVFVVYSKTKSCNAFKIKRKMYALKKENSWAEKVKNSLSGRGMWIILKGVSRLVTDEEMDWIIMRKKLEEQTESEKPSELLRKMKINRDIRSKKEVK